jgi:MSHA biogenesis protein MshP
MSKTFPKPTAGFAIVSAIVILVVLAGLAGYVVSMSATQSISFAQDILGARAYRAAHAGLDWGIARLLNTAACTGPDAYTGTPPTCASGSATCTQRTLYDPPTTTLAGLEDFKIVVGTCLCPAPPTGGTCILTATASSGNSTSPTYIERRLEAVVEHN